MSASKVPIVILSLFIVFDIFVWYEVVAGTPSARAEMYDLDVGQGDSELLVLPGGVKIMTDAGLPNGMALADLLKILPPGDRSIDVAVISHPQLDHFGGYADLIKSFRIGVIITNGRDDDPGVSQWFALTRAIKDKRIPLVVLGAGSKISYASTTIDFLSPNAEFVQSAELNDGAFVEKINTTDFTALWTADTGANVEQYLIDQGADLRADILKVGHHGSKYSSSDAFLRAVDPKVAVISVGAHNTYGHPAPETLARLASDTTAAVFRTDQLGTVHIYAEDGRLKIFTEK